MGTQDETTVDGRNTAPLDADRRGGQVRRKRPITLIPPTPFFKVGNHVFLLAFFCAFEHPPCGWKKFCTSSRSSGEAHVRGNFEEGGAGDIKSGVCFSMAFMRISKVVQYFVRPPNQHWRNNENYAVNTASNGTTNMRNNRY